LIGFSNELIESAHEICAALSLRFDETRSQQKHRELDEIERAKKA